MHQLINDRSNGNLKVSVITVSYNCSETIAKTMCSVLSQTHQNIEYIIIDGCSTDDTHQIIKSNMDGRVRLVIEDDEGIYDAMNKGFALVTGDIIYFLNSGDYFFDETILEKICSTFISDNDIDIAYGDIILYDKNDRRLLKMKRETPFHVMSRCGICHQALFVKKSSFFDKKPFDIKYKVFADYNWLLDGLYNHNFSLKYLNTPVVYYQAGGFSQQEVGKYASERLSIRKKQIPQAINHNIIIIIRHYFEILYFIIVCFYLIYNHVKHNLKMRVSKHL